MVKRHFYGTKASRRRQLRPLMFDSLEDRRLLAGLNVLVFEDVNATSELEPAEDRMINDRVVFADLNHNETLDTDEPYAVSDADGVASFTNLPAGDLTIAVLAQAGSGKTIRIDSADSPTVAAIAALVKPNNQPPQWSSDSINFGVLEEASVNIQGGMVRARVRNLDFDPIFVFLKNEPTSGSVAWNVTDGGIYTPNKDFDGSEALAAYAYDGQSWSGAMSVNIDVLPVDDLPTALHVQFVGQVAENEPGALLGTFEIDDVDGGAPQFSWGITTGVDVLFTSDKSGEFRLPAKVSLNYEQGKTLAVSVRLAGDPSAAAQLTANSEIPVIDTNDPVVAINFTGSVQVEEFRRGFRFGSVAVLDEDINQSFIWTVSDDRFVVDENNSLRLIDDAYLSTKESDQIELIVTATSEDGVDLINKEITIEVLEAPPPFQNQAMPLDVDDDGAVTVLDVLAVVNALNSRRNRMLDGAPPNEKFDYVDVNGDRVLSPIDVLVLVNHINASRRGSLGGASEPQGSSSGGNSQDNFSSNRTAQPTGNSVSSRTMETATEVEVTQLEQAVDTFARQSQLDSWEEVQAFQSLNEYLDSLKRK